MPDTLSQYNHVISKCRDLFDKKTKDYGTAWRILRLPTITDQILIKAKRIRSIQEKGKQLVEDPIRDEFIGIINYCIIAILQNDLNESDEGLDVGDKVIGWYDSVVDDIKELLFFKNHDYDDVWRDMRISSMTDLILTKLLRIKSIEDNNGSTLVSEGVVPGYRDIVNYSVFCLILMGEADNL